MHLSFSFLRCPVNYIPTPSTLCFNRLSLIGFDFSRFSQLWSNNPANPYTLILSPAARNHESQNTTSTTP